jgi:hypothetical protein
VGSVDHLIGAWRAHLDASGVHRPDIDEMEAHLRARIADLVAAGLSEDEALLVALRRLGALDVPTRRFAGDHGDLLWGGLDLQRGEPPASPAGRLIEAGVAAGLAGLAVQLVWLFGISPESAEWGIFMRRNAALMVLPFLVWFLGRRHGFTLRLAAGAATPLAIAAVVVNSYPWSEGSSTELLAVLHLPVVIWFVVGYAHSGGEWRSMDRRMTFVRFSGEWLISYVLIALGGGVLLALTGLILTPVSGEVAERVVEWVVVSGAAGAVIVAAWLVEARKTVVESVAPALTRIFTPLFAVMLFGAALAYVISGPGDGFDRDLLVVFDALLVVILGLVVFGMSASDSMRPPDWFDRIQLVAVLSGLALDLMVLASLVARVADLGFTPNRVAVLGLNLVLLVDLAGAAWLSIRFLRGRQTRGALQHWQMAYLPVIGLWALAVAALLPPLFGFR